MSRHRASVHRLENFMPELLDDMLLGDDGGGPAASISWRVSSVAKTDSPTTSTRGSVRLIQAVARMPLTRGMLISITTTEGRS